MTDSEINLAIGSLRTTCEVGRFLINFGSELNIYQFALCNVAISIILDNNLGIYRDALYYIGYYDAMLVSLSHVRCEKYTTMESEKYIEYIAVLRDKILFV